MSLSGGLCGGWKSVLWYVWTITTFTLCHVCHCMMVQILTSVLEEQTTVIEMLTASTLRVASSVTVGMATRETEEYAQV